MSENYRDRDLREIVRYWKGRVCPHNALFAECSICGKPVEPELAQAILAMRRELRQLDKKLMFLAGYCAPMSAFAPETVDHFKEALNCVERALRCGHVATMGVAP